MGFYKLQGESIGSWKFRTFEKYFELFVVEAVFPDLNSQSRPSRTRAQKVSFEKPTAPATQVEFFLGGGWASILFYYVGTSAEQN